MFRWPAREFLVIEWGGLEFTTDPRTPAVPSFLIQDFSGWSDGWTDSSSTMDSPGGRGVLTTSTEVSPRAISLTAYVSWEDGYARDSEGLYALIEEIEDAAGDILVVHEPGKDSREATVRLVSSKITPVSRFSSVAVFTFQADDPLRFSSDPVPLPAGKNVSVKNVGTHDSFPWVTVTGPTSKAPTVKVGSKSFTAPKALTAGQVLDVDCAHAEMRVDGVLVYPLLTTWPQIAKGATATCSASEGTATVRRVSAWR